MAKKDEFNLVNLPEECKDPSISKDDFKLVQVDAKIHDQKFETKPTTFFKDCLKRFSKNKSSVVAGIILGILLLMSVVVPIAFKTNEIHDTSVSHPEIYYLEPRLFNAGTGFWDGTKKMTDIAVDTSPENKEDWGPDAKIYNRNAIMDLVIGEEQYTNTPNKYAKDGYIQFGYFNIPSDVDYITYSTQLNVRQLATSEVKPVIDDDPTAKANIIEIIELYSPEKVEQLDTLTVQDITAKIKYEDKDDGDAKKEKIVPVDEITLDTSTIGKNIEGSVKVGSLTETFKIEVIEKQDVTFDFNEKLEIINFVTLDKAKLANSDEKTKTYPEGYTDAKSALFLYFEQEMIPHEVQLSEYKLAHDIGGVDEKINVLEKFEKYCADNSLDSKVSDIQLQVRVLKNENSTQNACTLIKSIKIESSSVHSNVKENFESYSFKNGNEVYIRTKNDGGVWVNRSNSNYSKETNYLVKAVLCSFTYDTYEAVLGRVERVIFMEELRAMANKGYIKFKLVNAVDEYGNYAKDEYGNYYLDPDKFECEILDTKKCALAEPFKIEDVVLDKDTGIPDRVTCKVLRYKMDPYNLDEMPRFLLGTDKSGRDMFIYVFEGLRTSLLLGVITSAICFLFGLLWGSISGYFGGTVDLAMERFTDILSGVPWIVVMTLTIIHLGSTFFTFALALCLTGWIGTSHTTRTQFYRFRGREYVLASRTLGASHGRLIARHILPNAMGTIITSAVLMVPSIIFSEATISYLGLGFKNLASLGVILSDNQVELTNHPYLLIFPAVIIALLMISFNLFGNGLRDAVNPSLKGEGE